MEKINDFATFDSGTSEKLSDEVSVVSEVHRSTVEAVVQPPWMIRRALAAVGFIGVCCVVIALTGYFAHSKRSSNSSSGLSSSLSPPPSPVDVTSSPAVFDAFPTEAPLAFSSTSPVSNGDGESRSPHSNGPVQAPGKPLEESYPTHIPTALPSNTFVALSLNPSLKPSLEPTSGPISYLSGTTDQPTIAPLFQSKFQPILINAGGDLYTDSKGNVWLADDAFTTSGTVYNNSCPGIGTPTAIDSGLFCTGRVHMKDYDTPVPNGDYAVSLHFYEKFEHSLFDVYLENLLVDREFGERPNGTTFSIEAFTAVADGSLTIAFANQTSGPNISAIEIHMANPTIVGDLPTTNLTYIPGSLTVEMEGLILSEGLTARIIAKAGRRVDLFNGTKSRRAFHDMPDAGATFRDTRQGNEGGWIYVSNSEANPDKGQNYSRFPGGVGAITFDAKGNVIDFSVVLNNTRQNCGGTFFFFLSDIYVVV